MRHFEYSCCCKWRAYPNSFNSIAFIHAFDYLFDFKLYIYISHLCSWLSLITNSVQFHIFDHDHQYAINSIWIQHMPRIRFTLCLLTCNRWYYFWYCFVSFRLIPSKWIHKFMVILFNLKLLLYAVWCHDIIRIYYTSNMCANLKFMIAQFNRRKKRNLKSFSLYLMNVNDLPNKNHDRNSSKKDSPPCFLCVDHTRLLLILIE